MVTRKNVMRLALGLVVASGMAFTAPSMVGEAYALGGCTITCAGGSCTGSDGYSCTCETNGTPSCKPAKQELE